MTKNDKNDKRMINSILSMILSKFRVKIFIIDFFFEQKKTKLSSQGTLILLIILVKNKENLIYS